MGFFSRKDQVRVSEGSQIVLETSGWDAEWISYSLTGEGREAIDTTHTRSPDGYREFIPAGFVNPGTIEVTYHHDFERPPPLDADPEPVRLVLRKPGSTERVIYGGMGFLTGSSRDVPESPGKITGTVTIQRTGKWTTLPAEPVEAT